MSLPPALQPSDEIWSELRRHLEWSQGFSLFFLFGRPRATALIRDRLVDTLRLRALTLQRVIPNDPAAAPEQVIGTVLNASDPLNAIGAPLWVELDRHPDDPLWHLARGRVLTALNERRFLLERDVRRPVIFVLPLGYRRIALEIAPDLWQVRTFSADIGGVADATSSKKDAYTRGWQDSMPPMAPEPGAGALPTSVQEWDRIKGSDPGSVALVLGWRAARDAERLGDLLLSHRLAVEAVDIARLRQRRGTPQLSVADRQLRVSLRLLGDIASNLGRLAEADQAYRQGLELARRILSTEGESPEALRNVSESLRDVGDVARQLWRLEEAEQVYEESLDSVRRVLRAVGETPAALRDVTVSLNGIGDVARALGRLKAAERSYQEGLGLARRVLAADGETPEALRGVSASLGRVGDVARELGRLEEAARASREGLELARRAQAADDTPGTLRHVSASLSRVGEQAEQAYKEALELARRVLVSGGETPEALRDLALSLFRLGDVVRELGRPDDAEQGYREGVDVLRALREKVGDSRQLIDELASSLVRLAGVHPATNRGSEAQEHLREAESLLDRLSLVFPEHPEYEARLKIVKSLRLGV